MPRHRIPVALARALALMCALSPLTVLAADNGPVDVIGPDIMYLGVTENVTQFPGPVPPSLFMPNYWESPPATLGSQTPPQVLGNDLVFTPSVNFRVEAQNGSAALADGNLSMQIMTTNPSGHIGSLVISEGGGYGVLGGPGNSASDSLIASFPSGGLTITRVGNMDVNVPVIPTFVFNRTGGALMTTGPDSITLENNGAGSWTGVATYDINAALAAANLTGNVTKLSLSLDNILFVQTTENGFATIDKKTFQISPGFLVPEPGTLVLATLGGLMVGVTVLRRSRRP